MLRCVHIFPLPKQRFSGSAPVNREGKRRGGEMAGMKGKRGDAARGGAGLALLCSGSSQERHRGLNWRASKDAFIFHSTIAALTADGVRMYEPPLFPTRTATKTPPDPFRFPEEQHLKLGPAPTQSVRKRKISISQWNVVDGVPSCSPPLRRTYAKA